MIDIESTVFDRVAEALEEKYGGIYVASVPLAGAPPELPAVCLWEQSNVALAKSQTAQSRENHAKLMYQCEVYSNRQSGKTANMKISLFISHPIHSRSLQAPPSSRAG